MVLHGKNTILNYLFSDKQFYSSSSKRKLESGASLQEIKCEELKKSFIVPYNAYELVYMIENNTIKCDDTFLQLNLFSRKLKEYKSSNEENSKIVRSTILSASINGNWKDGEVDSSANANNKRYESPYPLLDNFVLATLGSRGGTKGSISSWSIYTNNKMTKENNSENTFTSPTKDNSKYNSYRIRYQIFGNRFCENIGRQHKSNGIILEVDLLLSTLYQSCWDPDCRYFKSNPIHVPLSILPCYDDLEMKYNDKKKELLHI